MALRVGRDGTARKRENCPSCGEMVEKVIVPSQHGSQVQQYTYHVREEDDEAKRCKYDGGPGSGGAFRRKERYPGDTS
jgi:hypothetical protein